MASPAPVRSAAPAPRPVTPPRQAPVSQPPTQAGAVTPPRPQVPSAQQIRQTGQAVADHADQIGQAARQVQQHPELVRRGAQEIANHPEAVRRVRRGRVLDSVSVLLPSGPQRLATVVPAWRHGLGAGPGAAALGRMLTARGIAVPAVLDPPVAVAS